MPEPQQVTSMRALEASRAAFVARLTAAATHELRNVLAIVKESAGLVQDLRAMGASADGRADAALGRIEAQVGRGAELLTSLNRLAHGLDRDEESVDLAEAARHVTVLCRRYARQWERSVEARGEGAVLARANALDVYRALVAGVEWCVEVVPEGGTVVVRAESVDGNPTVRLAGELPVAGVADGAVPDGTATRVAAEPARDADWPALEASLGGLPARVVRDGAWFSLLFE
ncbi:MAG: hypothetical protein P8Z36_09465 [Gemmatimonadota bacterium]